MWLLGEQFFPKLAGDGRSNVCITILTLYLCSGKHVAPHNELAYTLYMNKNSIKIIGAIVLVLGIGAITVLILGATTPKATTETSSQNTNETSAADAAAEAAEAKQLELQRQDVETKNVLSKVVSAVTTYATNNRGAFPSTDAQLAQFSQTYLPGEALTNAAATTTYKLALNATAPSPAVISYQPGFVCSAEDSAAAPIAGTRRQFALTTTLPSGVNYCLSS